MTPGAAPIGHVRDLPPEGQIAVWCLRSLGQKSSGLARTMGARQAKAVMDRCDDAAQFLARYARRPLMRHSPECPCLGADEAAFAQLCMLIHDGERDEALMLAMVICRADLAPCLLPLVEAFTLAVARGVALSATTPQTTTAPQRETLH